MNDIIRLLGWLPDLLAGAILLLMAALLAVLVHWLFMRALRTVIPRERVFFQNLLLETKVPTRWAVINFAIGTALPFAPFTSQVSSTIGNLVTASFIALIGWIALKALDLAVMVHLRQYRIDVEDNLLARKHITQTRILRRAAALVIIVVTIAAGLMTFESVRQYGVSLLAAGGAAGIIVGLAAQPVLSNLFAGLQLALTQPIRIDDAVIVEGEWGTIEEITATYVVIKVWDWRRLVVPLRYFIEQPFQNWTRETASLIGVVMLYLDYRAPIDQIRAKLEEVAGASKLWDRRVVNLQVVEAFETTIQVRALVSAKNAPTAFDLRCEVREKLISYIQSEMPQALPHVRNEVNMSGAKSAASTL